MRKDPRTVTKASDEKDLMAALPDKDTAKLSINVAVTLSQFDKDEVIEISNPYWTHQNK